MGHVMSNGNSVEAYEAARLDNFAIDIANHKARLDHHENMLETKVSKDTFEPFKLVLYTLMTTFAAAVIGAAAHIVGIKVN